MLLPSDVFYQDSGTISLILEGGTLQIFSAYALKIIGK